MAGASGGYIDSNYYSGLGAKTSGYIELEAGEKLYFYVGGQGSAITTPNSLISGGYNGGGDAFTESSNDSTATSGGGATDVRLVGGTWDNTSSLISRIMVAGGGGGSNNISSNIYIGYGGAGGTLHGLSGESNQGEYYGTGGTQISGGVNARGDNLLNGKFGIGGGYYGAATNAGTGGGGYYGGASGAGYRSGGGGGSSYISGYAGVNSVEESTTITHTNNTLHYSGKYFIGGQMISGANSGNGYAKIVYVDTKPKRKNTNLNNVRYIKDCINDNSSVYHRNYWVEVQAIKDGINIAKGKNIIGTVEDVTNYEYEEAVDGSLGSYAATSTSTPPGNTCVIVDLGEEYDLDEIMILHARWRVSYDNITSVSSDNQNWKVVLNETTPEIHDAKRVNAYRDTYNGYVQDGLVLWYDGYLHSETDNHNFGHNNSSTTWKDLSGTGNDVTISGGTWNYNYLSFDGVDDWAYDTNGATYNIDKEHTIEVLLKPRKIDADTWQMIFNTVDTGLGVLQYGGLWIDKRNAIYYEIADGSSFVISQSVTLNSEDTGKYILMTNVRNDKNYRLYKSGNYVKSSTVTWDAKTPSNMIRIGGMGAYYFQGEIYSIRVYNKALTDEEVLHNYLYDKQTFNLE